MSINISLKAKMINRDRDLSGRPEDEKAWRDSRATKAAFTLAYICVLTLGALLSWHAAVKLFNVPEFLIPDPIEVARAFQGNIPLILRETGTTTFEILAGFGLSVIVGIPLALAIFLSPTFSKIVYPGLIASQAVPKVAIAPLLVVWFGYGLFPKIFIAFLIAFFPIVVNTVTGLGATEREKLVLARSMGFSAMNTFLKIRLPSAAPNIFSGTQDRDHIGRRGRHCWRVRRRQRRAWLPIDGGKRQYGYSLTVRASHYSDASRCYSLCDCRGGGASARAGP